MTLLLHLADFNERRWADGFAAALPLGLDTPIGEDGKVVNLLPLVGSDSADGAACCADGTCSIG